MSFYGFLIYDLLILSRHSNEDEKNQQVKQIIKDKNKEFLFFISDKIMSIRSLPNIKVNYKLNYIFYDNKIVYLDKNDPNTIGFFIPMIILNKLNLSTMET